MDKLRSGCPGLNALLLPACAEIVNAFFTAPYILFAAASNETSRLFENVCRASLKIQAGSDPSPEQEQAIERFKSRFRATAVPLLAQVHGAARREPDPATAFRGVRFSSEREVEEYVASLEGGLLERQVQSCSVSLHRPLQVFAGPLDVPPTALALRMSACGYSDFQQPYRLLCIFDGSRPLAVREWNLSNLEEKEV